MLILKRFRDLLTQLLRSCGASGVTLGMPCRLLLEMLGPDKHMENHCFSQFFHGLVGIQRDFGRLETQFS